MLQGDWSEAKNNRLVKKMDANGDGVLQASEFADGFEKALPEDQKKFKMVVKEFMDVAKSCRENKQASRDKEEKAAKKAEKKTAKEPVKSPSPVRADGYQRPQRPLRVGSSPPKAREPETKLTKEPPQPAAAAAAAAPAAAIVDDSTVAGSSLVKAERITQLLAVFAVFDLDASGTIEASELLQLGQMRRRCTQCSLLRSL